MVSGKPNDFAPQTPRDPNQLAKSIIDIATGEKADRDPTPRSRAKTRLRWRWARRAGRRARTVCRQSDGPKLRYQPLKQGGVIVRTKKSKLRNHSISHASHQDIRLHHRIAKSVAILALRAAPYKHRATSVRQKFRQMPLEIGMLH